MGGLLTLPSFTKVFPSLCTTQACTNGLTDSEKLHQSTIQGKIDLPFSSLSLTLRLGISISSYNLGCFAGSLFIMRLGDVFGRRMSIFIGCTIVSIGAILQSTSFGLSQFIVGRVVCGLGTGINTATVPVWQAECTKPHLRGPIMAMETSLVIAGVMVSYWIDFGLSYAEPSPAAWRFPIAFQLVFSIFILAMIFEMPESPRWLMLKDRTDEAAETMSVIYDLPLDDNFITEELFAIRATLQLGESTGFRKMFQASPLKTRTRAILAVSIQVISQLTGINIITYYAATIYQNEIGLSPFISRVLAACNGTQYFIASIFSIPLVRYMNRRPLLLMATTGLGMSMIVLAILNSIGGKGPGIAAATFLFIYNTFFGIAWAQISWIYPAEITPLSIRAQANALSTSSNWICNFMVVMITPISFNNIGWRTYIVFAVFNLASLPIIYFFYPETRSRSLEEIDLIFTGSRNIFDAVKKSKTEKRHFDHHGHLVQSLEHDLRERKVAEGMVGPVEAEHHEMAPGA